MTKKPYKVIDGGTTYRIITPEEAETLLDAPGKTTDVYAITDQEAVDEYNEQLGENGIPVHRVERLQASSDVQLYIHQFGTRTFAIRVGNLSNMLLNMED